MTLPPWMRAIQQTYAFHVGVAAFAMAGVTAFKFFSDHSQFSWAGVTDGLIAGGGYLFAALQHSPGSASFKPDGTPNKQVAMVVATQAAVAAEKQG